MAINVTSNIANVTVNTTSNVVTVSSTPVNVTLSASAFTSNASIRQAIGTQNVSGFGNLTYDTSANSNGIIQYTGVSSSDIRTQLSGTSPITYNSSTGAIGLEQSLSNITLKQYQETVVSHGNSSGNISVDVANGTIHKFTLTGNVTSIAIPNIQTGGSATIILTQDASGGHALDTTTFPVNWTGWDFVNDFQTLDVIAGNYSVLTVLWDGTKYYASLVIDSQVALETLDVTGNITGGNVHSLGVITSTGDITSTANVNGAYILGDGSQLTGLDYLTNAEVKTYIEAQGLSATANLTTTANITGAKLVNTEIDSDANITTTANVSGGYILGNISQATGIVLGDITAVTAGQGLAGGGTSGDVVLSVNGGTGIAVVGDNVTVDLSPFSTTDLSEGTNQYFTNARAVTAGIGSFLRISEDNFMTGSGTLTNTVIISEPVANAPKKLRLWGNTDIIGLSTNNTVGLQFIADAAANFGANSNINLSSSSYIQGAGIIDTSGNITTTANVSGAYILGDGSQLTNIPHPADAVTSVNTQTGVVVLDTDDIAEGTTNLYYTQGRFDSSFSAENTDNLTEGTNLYYTDVRSRSAVSLATPASASGGGALAYNSSTGAFTFTPADTQTDSEVRALLSTTTASASAGGSLVYDSGTGVFTFAPADLSTKIALTDLSVTTATASGDGSLTYNNASGVFTFTPADSEASRYGDSNVATLLSAFGSNTISSTADITTTANVNADHIISASAQPLQLKGQTDGIQLDKTIATVSSRIFDTDTTGYSVADGDFGSAAITTSNVPALLVQVAGTSGTNTLTAAKILGGYTGSWAGLQTGALDTFNTTSQGGSETNFENFIANFLTDAHGAGWLLYNIATGSTTTALPVNGHVTSIVGDTITLSDNLLQTISYGTLPGYPAGVGYSAVLIPAAYSSTQNIGFSVSGDEANTSLPFTSALPRFNQYDLPETLSNVTLDRVSYGDATVSMANVVMRHIADIKTGPDSAIRIPRAILVGANATPDILSVGTDGVLPPTSTLGVTVEQDGLTDFGGVDTTPQLKVMFNNYDTNSLATYTTYPNWTAFLGQSGNATVDMPYLGAPNFNFKHLGGTKGTTLVSSAGDIPGRVTFNTVSTGIAGASAGLDNFNPPASITAMVGGAGDLTTMANTDMHFQSTYSTSYRNGTTTAGGSIPRTFLSSSAGNTVLAAKSDGKITLRPVRDYGDASASASYIDNRYAPNLHEYHEFLGAGFANTTTKAGTIVEVQSKSGQTNASTADFNYDSTGDSTLRLSTHNANTVVKTYWDITNENVGSNLQISQDGNDKVAIGDKETVFSHRVRFQNLTSAEIIALTGMAVGDTVYNTTEATLCFYNGVGTYGWQIVTSTDLP